ncbi:hypothetical protein THF1C08_170048 [Vibrio jasicida]|uniref:Uncharacterized protein n=1 Tax=Vibrio jasicida TaxID=766224 RepID=A0AAU9QHN6_9VIBR|nr:hypothetical protein THF1C08_170048 [Vibrio jasicida]CAH1579985.1 hypothetical protein THF1A12_160046 [Vibrio jasicida]CAH1608313.1 hypothetical protein THF5G08_60033 [Vibrio jasicida]
MVFYPYTLLDIILKILQNQLHYEHGVRFMVPLPDLMLINLIKL